MASAVMVSRTEFSPFGSFSPNPSLKLFSSALHLTSCFVSAFFAVNSMVKMSGPSYCLNLIVFPGFSLRSFRSFFEPISSSSISHTMFCARSLATLVFAGLCESFVEIEMLYEPGIHALMSVLEVFQKTWWSSPNSVQSVVPEAIRVPFAA